MAASYPLSATSQRPQIIETPSGEFLYLILMVLIACLCLTWHTRRRVASVADKSYDSNICPLNCKEIALKQRSAMLTEYVILVNLIG